MKQLSGLAAFAIVLAAMAVGCADETGEGSSELGTVNVNLMVGNNDVTSVTFDLSCDDGFTLSGELNVVDDRDPPVFATIMALPPGDCSITLTAFDDQGATLCEGSKDFTVLANETVSVDVVLVCTGDGEELLGNAEINGTFVFVDGNACPRLHFFNAVPINVPAEGSTATVLVSDREGDPIRTLMTATNGSFANPDAQSTTYTCGNATGNQTLTVTVGNREPECTQSKSFDVTCPGTNPCDGVVCDDTGNECTAAECNPDTGLCEVSDLDGNECTAGGGGGDIAINGGFETGAFNDGSPDASWQQFPGGGIQTITTDNPSAGTYAANLNVPVRGPTDGPVDNLIKNANLEAGNLTPGQSITVTWDMRGSLSGAGGVVFVELFSELSGGGTSKAEIYTNAPLNPAADWESFSWTTTLGDDVNGGVTLQLKAACGPVEGCGVDVYFDNVTIVIPGGGSEPGTCGGGICVPNAECAVDGDCPPTGNECIDAVCNAGTCGTSNNTNACDGGAGTCSAGVCEPNAEAFYEQDFNQLPIDPGGLIGDGWRYFINVFQGDGTYRFGFGGDAPQGPQISNLVTGEGGLEQEPQQLVVYSDYECCAPDVGHRNPTDLVETNVFQERTIGAADVGKTFTFVFQAKGGNLAGSTTANGFIKTLDPGAGFGESAVDRADTTGLPDTWGGFTVSILIPNDTFIGHILQFGFQTNASNGEDSGNFYDNVLVTD